MKVLPMFGLGLLVLVSGLSFQPALQAAQKEISIPVRFSVVTNLTMEKKGIEMASWVSEADIENEIMPEVNRIWSGANIRFVVTEIGETGTRNPPEKAALIDYVINAKRDRYGRADPVRIEKLDQLIHWGQYDESMINIYLVPYLGETSQGHARRKTNRVFVAQYTDKVSRAKHPPKPFQLTEAQPFQEGSLSRTVAHEIGHILGLGHPDSSTQTTFGRLMGGRDQGYTLTSEEIDQARSIGHEKFGG